MSLSFPGLLGASLPPRWTGWKKNSSTVTCKHGASELIVHYSTQGQIKVGELFETCHRSLLGLDIMSWDMWKFSEESWNWSWGMWATGQKSFDDQFRSPLRSSIPLPPVRGDWLESRFWPSSPEGLSSDVESVCSSEALLFLIPALKVWLEVRPLRTFWFPQAFWLHWFFACCSGMWFFTAFDLFEELRYCKCFNCLLIDMFENCVV